MCSIRREILLLNYKADIEDDEGMGEFEDEQDM